MDNLESFYNKFIAMWGGPRANATAPEYVIFLGRYMKAGDDFYNRFYTIEGIATQLNDFERDIGLIYYYDSEKKEIINVPISLKAIGYESAK